MSENKENQWLAVADISEKIGIPVETIRRYIRSHGIHMKVKKIHKRYVIHNESMTVFQQIRELYADGKNVEEVERTLSDRGIPVTVTVKNNSDESVTVNMADELKRMNEQLEEQKKFNEQQAEFNKVLLEQLKQQQEYIDQKLEKQEERQNKRDQILIESLRNSMQEQQKAIAEVSASKESDVNNSKKQSFWKRLFG